MGLPAGASGTCNVHSQHHTKDTPDGGTPAPTNLGTPSGGPLGNLGNGGVSALRSCDTPNERYYTSAVTSSRVMLAPPLTGSLSLAAAYPFVTTWVLRAAASPLFHFTL
jgi:hypothetical protein